MENNKLMNTMMATERQKYRRMAEERVADEVRQLLSHNEGEGLKWRGTNVDLMEALHVAYSTGILTDENGICLSFSHIVGRACSVLHMAVPSNPYETAARGRRRKGRLMSTYMDRYELQMRQSTSVLWQEIEKQV